MSPSRQDLWAELPEASLQCCSDPTPMQKMRSMVKCPVSLGLIHATQLSITRTTSPMLTVEHAAVYVLRCRFHNLCAHRMQSETHLVTFRCCCEDAGPSRSPRGTSEGRQGPQGRRFVAEVTRKRPVNSCARHWSRTRGGRASRRRVLLLSLARAHATHVARMSQDA